VTLYVGKPPPKRGGGAWAAVRTALWLLLLSLVVGFAIGLVVRCHLERPARFIGAAVGASRFIGAAEAARMEADS
jgi:hypothetical protein